MTYDSTWESVKQHPLPTWYQDAKLGIFVHWGLFSVPAWAPHGGDIDKQVAENGWESMFANNPYAEWYLNTLRIGDTPTHRHHLNTYGERFSYDDFAAMFQNAAEQWDPNHWVDLFQKVGARYVVLVTKHHDGFLLWPSQYTSPHKSERYGTNRDIVGELAHALHQRGIMLGLYYSGGLDWSFNQTPVRSYMDVYSTIVQSPDFVEYMNNHWRELIDRYKPSVLWNDIGAPSTANLPELFAYYYNNVPEGVINDRWSQRLPDHIPGPGEMINPPPSEHCDYTTPEYAAYDQIMLKKWESTRGIGHSFGYNLNEGEADHLSVRELIHSFVNIVSKNGNLLLNVGPTAEGMIPELQHQRLLGLGAWLDVNGEGIFSTRPWHIPREQTREGTTVCYTQKGDSLYAILLNTPHTSTATLENLRAEESTKVHLLGHSELLPWTQGGNSIAITLPDNLPKTPAFTLKITPRPQFLNL
jgi:alpha-L-fucosidase